MAGCFDFFRSREGRSKTKKCFFTALIVINYLLLFLDYILDIVYFFYIDFKSKNLRIAQGISFFLIPVFIYALSFQYYIRKSRENLCEILLLAFLGPFICILYPISKIFAFFPKEIEMFFRLRDIQFLVESLPQIIIQGTNNCMNNSWSHFAKLSFTINVMSVIWHSIRQAYCWYDRQHLSFLKNIENRVIDSIHGELNQLTNRNVQEDQLLLFIKKKYYEKFNYMHFFEQSSINMIPDIDENNLNVLIEEKLNSFYSRNYNFKIIRISECKKCLHPGILLFSHIITMSTIWLANLAYVISAEFYVEYERYICLLFIAVTFLVSIYWSFGSDKSHIIKHWFWVKMCTYSLFEQLMDFLYNNKIKTKKRIVNEVLNLLLGWIPLIVIEGSNNFRVEKSGGVYSAVIILNIISLLLAVCRIYYLVTLKIINPNITNGDKVHPSK